MKPSPFGSGLFSLETPILASCRFVAAAWLGFVCLALSAGSAPAAQADGKQGGKPVPARVVANRTVPRVEPPDTALRLSPEPKPHEIASARVFSEPLVSTGGEPDAAENLAVGRALLRHTRHTDADDVSHLTDYLAAHPRGKWSASVLYNLGMDYFHSGYWSKAVDALEKSWSLSKDATDPKAKALADRAGGELAMLYARLGYVSQLDALLKSFDGRTVVGSATERIAGARQGLWAMQHTPWIAFRCGPLALDRIRAVKDPNLVANANIQDSHATTNGYSLTQLQQLSRDLGMFYQIALRQRGAAFLTPSVAHFKVNHYAALIRQHGSRYLIKDPTFGNDLWVSEKALEEEGSGYFLVPRGPLPAGWRAVNDAEGAAIWGKGQTYNNDPNDTTPDDDKKDQCPVGGGMAVANAHLMTVSLNIMDTPVGYRPPVGPAVYFTATYNQREANQPANFSYSNLGPKWTFNWLAYITDNPGSPLDNVEYYVSGGGTELFSGFDTNTQAFANQIRSQALLKRTSTNSYEMLFPDGSKNIFGQPDGTVGAGRRVFLSQVLDPAGNAVELTYDASFRIVAIRDAIGQVTTFGYGYAPDTNKITSVVDPFGRYATFNYDSSGRLTNITDVIGLTSQFTYDGGDFIQALTTPYGTTRFAKGDSGRTRWLETTDPLGGTDRVEYSENTDVGIPNSEPASVLPQGMFLRNSIIYARNTFVWNKKAYAEARGDYTKAKIYHWQHSEDYSSAVGILESTKMPFENRVWYNYDGQPQNDEGATVRGTSDRPIKIGRVLDDGTTQLYRYEYNSMGQVTKSVDPMGRTMTYIYDSNGIDLLEVRQTTGGQNDLLAKYLYNSQHRLVSVQDTAGQTTTNIYNSLGQLLSTTNPRLETRTFHYDTNGFLKSVDGPLPGGGDTIQFAYDDFGHIQTFTDTDGYTLRFAYDYLDRHTGTMYPDGSSESFVYDKLDRILARDRQGRETQFGYNALRQRASLVDPLLRTNRYQWCDCGAPEMLVDALGRTTFLLHDVQGRTKEKQYADGSKITYFYENTTSRLKAIRDEKGQVKNLEYYPDNKLKRVSYTNVAVLTPAFTYEYDTNYVRIRTMQDGFGLTTFDYYPVGVLGALRLSSVDGPWANDTVVYQYDLLGRVQSRSINGVAQIVSLDALGRPSTISNILGSFSYAFDGATERLVDLTYPNRQRTHFDYYDDLRDRRLLEIRHSKPDASLLSRFAYAYEPAGNITNWVQEAGGAVQTWAIGYDAADQVKSAAVAVGDSTLKTYGYEYDPVGNHLAHTADGVRSAFSYNALNELISGSTGRTNAVSLEWDGEHRLSAINQGTHRTEFAYDGLGRRAGIVERENGVLQSERRFVWCNAEIVEERDTTGAMVQKRFFREGYRDELSGGVNYFYTHDHLRSVRQVTDTSGTVQGRLDYDLFGNRTKQGNGDSDFGFAGYFWHGQSGLLLTLMRAYDPLFGRWLSRDPIGERGNINLFQYAVNNPVRYSDPFGLQECEIRLTLPPSDSDDPFNPNNWPPLQPNYDPNEPKIKPWDPDTLKSYEEVQLEEFQREFWSGGPDLHTHEENGIEIQKPDFKEVFRTRPLIE